MEQATQVIHVIPDIKFHPDDFSHSRAGPALVRVKVWIRPCGKQGYHIGYLLIREASGRA
ncbi:hypothetical protein GCM10008957_55530 [Deinococcus ruber]|uniref:Uncharacterized protein n=1 Tax=Deinococcus ruber TaxID=1848197 RepID=A0A918KXC9_9DEIO|nr:hypothetical protein GCM10008957_55530 [Deinococcus ruber]